MSELVKDIAFWSVVSSGLVAILSVFIAPLTNLLVENAKSKRQQKSNDFEKLKETTTNLLASMQWFTIRPTQGFNMREIAPEAQNLRKAFFDWEITLSRYLEKKDDEFLSEAANKILGSPYTLYEYHPEFTDELMDFSRKVGKRI